MYGCGLSSKEHHECQIKNKSDATLAIRFIIRGVWTLVHQQQDGALQFIEVSGWTRSEPFGRTLISSFTERLSAKTNFLLLWKSIVTKVLEYKGNLNLKSNLYALLCIP